MESSADESYGQIRTQGMTHKLLLKVFSCLSVTPFSRHFRLGTLRSGGGGHHSGLVAIRSVFGAKGGISSGGRVNVWESARSRTRMTHRSAEWRAFRDTWHVVDPTERSWRVSKVAHAESYLSSLCSSSLISQSLHIFQT